MNKKPKEKKPQHILSKPRENAVGSNRFAVLHAAAKRASEAFRRGFYLEAICLTESLLATRLESRLAWVRKRKGNSEPVRFSTLGELCKGLLQADNASVKGEAFQRGIEDIN